MKSADLFFARYSNLPSIGKWLNHPRCIEAMDTVRPLFRKVGGPNPLRPGRADRVKQMRNDFLDAASHELKTPLTSLRLQLQLISRMAESQDVARLSPEKLKTLAEDAERQVARLTCLTENLLDASGIRAGKLELKPEAFDLSDLVSEEVKRFRSNPAFAGLEVHLHAPQPIPGQWDRTRVAQVLRTLLSNAAQYGLKRPIELQVWADRARARISVRDQGIGIAEADQERIFRQFERGVSGNRFNGLGLGLYIARQIALAHGGSLEVDSQQGSGSVFTLKLPLAPARPLRMVRPTDPV